MKVLETILNFLATLARIIFPRKQRPAAGNCPCPDPFPAPAEPPLPPDARDGSDPDLHRSDTLAQQQGHWGKQVEPIDIAGYSLIAVGLIGGIYKWFVL